MNTQLKSGSLEANDPSQRVARLPVKILQQGRSDCGVACLAMAADLSYADAREVFVSVGLADKRQKRPFSSNFQDLRRALSACGKASTIKHFAGWDRVGKSAILKVFVKKGVGWHWVYAGSDPQLGLFVLDPATDWPALEVPPGGITCALLDVYQPSGSYIEVGQGGL